MGKGGMFGSDGMGMEELILLKEMGILDGEKGSDQITKLMMFSSLQNNKFMEDMREYVKESKGGGGGGKKRRSSGDGGGSMFNLLQSVNSITSNSQFQVVESDLVGIESGIDLGEISSGYNLANWGTNTTNDGKYIKSLSNSVAYLAYLVRQLSGLERTENFYAMLEAFDGEKTWGNNANTASFLPIALLSNGSLGGGLGGAQPRAFRAPFTI